MPAAFDRCVRKIKAKAKGAAKNPYAVCRASMGADEDIKRRESRKKGRKR